MRTGIGEVFPEEGEAMLDLKQVAEFAVAPVGHRPASRISTTPCAMVCSRPRACILVCRAAHFLLPFFRLGKDGSCLTALSKSPPAWSACSICLRWNFSNSASASSLAISCEIFPA